MARYIGLVHKDKDSDYGVSFPDLPGLVSGGKTLDEARASAAEGLLFHLEGMREDGDPIPPPTPLHAAVAPDLDLVAIIFTDI